jgi:hypothetical protein
MPDQLSGAEQENKPQAPGRNSASDRDHYSNIDPNTKPPTHQIEETSYEKHSFLKRFKHAFTGYKAKQLYVSPKAWIEFIGLLVLVLYTYRAGQQAGAAIVAAKAAKDAADTAACALKQTETSSKLTLRPYVSVYDTITVGQIKNGKSFHAAATIKNSGLTIATDMHVCSDILIAPSTSPITDDYPCPDPNARNPARSLPPFALGPNVPSAISTKDQQASRVGELGHGLVMYFYGYVYYRDIITKRVEHHTTFCSFYDQTQNDWFVCDKHNSAD